MKSKQIIVFGKVQGVGFRNFTQKIANQLGIVGWVRNLLSSEVEILAHTSDDKVMESFILELKKGPLRSRVDKIEVNEVDSGDINCDTFAIRSDGEKKGVY